MTLQRGFFIPQEHGTIKEHFIEKVPSRPNFSSRYPSDAVTKHTGHKQLREENDLFWLHLEIVIHCRKKSKRELIPGHQVTLENSGERHHLMENERLARRKRRITRPEVWSLKCLETQTHTNRLLMMNMWHLIGSFYHRALGR